MPAPCLLTACEVPPRRSLRPCSITRRWRWRSASPCVFALSNGFHNAAAATATLVSTRAARPATAMALTTVVQPDRPARAGRRGGHHDRPRGQCAARTRSRRDRRRADRRDALESLHVAPGAAIQLGPRAGRRAGGCHVARFGTGRADLGTGHERSPGRRDRRPRRPAARGDLRARRRAHRRAPGHPRPAPGDPARGGPHPSPPAR